MKHYSLLIAMTLMTGCGQFEVSQPAPVAPVVTPVPVVEHCDTSDPIKTIVDTENIYRDILGQAPLTQGVTCNLYTVPTNTVSLAGSTLTSVLSYGYHGTFNQENSNVSVGLNILPPAVRPSYTSWFVVRCTGKLVVHNSDYVGFTLASDDGSVLYIDGAKVIDNDGNHGIITKTGSKLLHSGLHDFRLDYMEGPAGMQALQLLMNDNILEAKVLYH